MMNGGAIKGSPCRGVNPPLIVGRIIIIISFICVDVNVQKVANVQATAKFIPYFTFYVNNVILD